MNRDSTKQHLDLIELAYLEGDGELLPTQARDLTEHASHCRECQSIRDQMPTLYSVLERSKVEPEADFAARVLEGLPSAAWEMRRPGSWRLAALVFAALLGAAYALNLEAEPLGDALPWIGTVSAMAELFRSAALAGAGLLAASWSGLGLALGELLSRSTLALVMFGSFVLGVDLLLFRYLWRLSRREALANRRETGSRGR